MWRANECIWIFLIFDNALYKNVYPNTLWQTLIGFKVFGVLILVHAIVPYDCVIVLHIVVLCGCAFYYPHKCSLHWCFSSWHWYVFRQNSLWSNNLFFCGVVFSFWIDCIICGASVLHANLCNDSVVHVVLALVFTHWCFSHWSSTKCSSLWFYYCSSFLWSSLWPNLDVCLYHSSLVYLFLHGNLIIHHVCVGFIIHFFLHDDFLYKFLGLQLLDGTMEGEVSIGHQR